jgi:hypothetical protein
VLLAAAAGAGLAKSFYGAIAAAVLANARAARVLPLQSESKPVKTDLKIPCLKSDA